MGHATKFSRFRLPTALLCPAGRSTSESRSAGVSLRQYRTSAARWRCSTARSSFPSADTGAIAAPITALSSAFPSTSLARPRVSRRERAAAAYGEGGVSGDGQSLFAVTGNTFGATGWGDGEAVLRLSPDLARPTESRDYFAPADWRNLDRDDLDLGGTAALPLDVAGPNGARKLIFAIGKTGEAYLLDRDNFGGIGRPLARARVTTNIAITSPAVWNAPDGTFVALQGDGAHCPPGKPGDGLIVVKIRVEPAPAIETAWCGSVAGAGSPIVTTTDGHSDPIVLVVAADGDNRLHAFRGDDGEPLATPPETMRGLRHFQTLIAGEDRLYVAADGTIYAFAF